MIGVVTIIVLAFGVLLRGQKDKNEFYKATGRVTYLARTYQEYPVRHAGKYRYLQIDGYPKVFEVFIGNEAGDFKPDFERIDQLKIGDPLLVYYDESSREDDIRINRLAQYIDKEQQPYYIRGSWDKYMGCFLMGIGVFIGIWLLYLRSKGKII
jgi:hypothetical protein